MWGGLFSLETSTPHELTCLICLYYIYYDRQVFFICVSVSIRHVYNVWPMCVCVNDVCAGQGLEDFAKIWTSNTANEQCCRKNIEPYFTRVIVRCSCCCCCGFRCHYCCSIQRHQHCVGVYFFNAFDWRRLRSANHVCVCRFYYSCRHSVVSGKGGGRAMTLSLSAFSGVWWAINPTLKN